MKNLTAFFIIASLVDGYILIVSTDVIVTSCQTLEEALPIYEGPYWGIRPPPEGGRPRATPKSDGSIQKRKLTASKK